MSYITDESKTGDGANKTFTLANNYKAGTVLIRYNNKIFYEYREESANTLEFDFAPLATDEVLISYYTENEPNTRNAIRYITPRQITSMSRVTDLLAATTTDNEKIIREVEKYIDGFVGRWAKYYEIKESNDEYRGQLLTFPRVEDDVEDDDTAATIYPPIPDEITRAALYAVENIFIKGAPSSGASIEENADIESAKLGDYQFKRNNAKSSIEAAQRTLGNRAVALLSGFTKRFGEFKIEESRISRPESFLNSRQIFLRNN